MILYECDLAPPYIRLVLLILLRQYTNSTFPKCRM